MKYFPVAAVAINNPLNHKVIAINLNAVMCFLSHLLPLPVAGGRESNPRRSLLGLDEHETLPTELHSRWFLRVRMALRINNDKQSPDPTVKPTISG